MVLGSQNLVVFLHMAGCGYLLFLLLLRLSFVIVAG
jgi:hypothetical protein